MEKFKVTIKLIDVPHEDWANYLFDFTDKYNIKMEFHLDTYWCVMSWEAYQDMLLISNHFEAKGQTIIVKKGGL